MNKEFKDRIEQNPLLKVLKVVDIIKENDVIKTLIVDVERYNQNVMAEGTPIAKHIFQSIVEKWISGDDVLLVDNQTNEHSNRRKLDVIEMKTDQNGKISELKVNVSRLEPIPNNNCKVTVTNIKNIVENIIEAWEERNE